MAIDLFSRKATDRNWARGSLVTPPRLPTIKSPAMALEETLSTVEKKLRDNSVAFRGKGVVVSKRFHF